MNKNMIDTHMKRVIKKAYTYDHLTEFFVQYADDLWEVGSEKIEGAYVVWSIFNCGFYCGREYGVNVLLNYVKENWED